MTLASRCPTCGTVFRVVQDQLRVSQGWVRCGRCGEAFNAIEAMVPTSPADEALVPEHAATLVAPAPTEAVPETVPETVAESLPEARPEAEIADQAAEPPAAATATPDDVMALDTHTAVDTVAEDLVLARPPAPEAAEAAPHPAPSFVVQADRAARWQRPGMRLALSFAAGLALLGLAAQIGLAWRDRLAVSTPALKPWLQQACATLGCRIDDYRQINALSVEASGLVRAEGASTYRLSLTLRNRAAIDVAAPALDLTLTDSQGQTLARRVLTMQDLQLPLRTLKAGSELPIQVPLAIAGRPISGYTVELFYP